MRNAGLTFALPPSLGLESLRPVARHLASLLSNFGVETVWPCRSYAQLEEALLTGEADAAWAPPAVAARVHAAGGAIVLRAVRGGASSYRSALLCRSERRIDLKSLGGATGLAPLRAAWVDTRSAAGCLMPRHYLRERGAVVGMAFEESFLGSYRACFDAVLEGDADITASFVGRRGAGYIDLCGDLAPELRVLAWTDPIPNDGVVISPALSGDRAAATEQAIRSAFANVRVADKLALALDADAMVAPGPDSFEAIEALVDELDREPPAAPSDRRRRSRDSLPPALTSLVAVRAFG